MPQVSLADFVAAVQTGALVSFATDTVPALAARPEAGDRIYAAKGRSTDKPLILMGATWEALRPYVAGNDGELAQWRAVADRHWPGALTLVLPASDRLPAAINRQNTGTVGLRVPAHPLALHLLAQTGPLATTSANRSGEPPLETLEAIAAAFPMVYTLSPGALATLYDELGNGGDAPGDRPQGSGLPSTVVRWQRSGWEVLRSGAVALEAIAPEALAPEAAPKAEP
jgi:L-threonylcarbamoyladenylate synthase